VQAWEDGDVSAITALLTEDATFAMPPRPTWYRGRTAVGVFLAARPLSGAWRWHRARAGAKGQPTFGVYGSDAPGVRLVAHAIEVLTVDPAARIAGIATFHHREAFARFGLPDAIAA
jgi:RNA polymerase sigma-70 factor (ECF subfamily)